MKSYSPLLLLLFCLACGSSKQEKIETAKEPEATVRPATQANEAAKTATKSAPAIPKQRDYKYELLDESVREDLKVLDTLYMATPFYGKLNGSRYYIVADAVSDYWNYLEGDQQFGLVNEAYEQVLPAEYDLIHNPDAVLEGSFELTKGSKKGFFHFEKGLLLAPQFDLILPASGTSKTSAFGLSNNEWFTIDAENLAVKKYKGEASPVVAQSFSFDQTQVGEALMFESYNEYYEDELMDASGVIIPPSFTLDFGLGTKPMTSDYIQPGQEGDLHGSEEYKTSVIEKKSLAERFSAFFVSVLEKGIDARGYERESQDLVIYNEQARSFSSTNLIRLNEGDYFCREGQVKMVNDSIVEVKKNVQHYNATDDYMFESVFEFYMVDKNGSISKLNSDRYFDASKFVYLQERHFEGCFAKPTGNDNMYGVELEQTRHLSIEDLNIMRNEIFAEYGYKFTTEKWQQYFAEKDWYQPQYEDVNDKLSEIDKANVQTILRVREKMQGKEKEVTQPEIAVYAAAG